MAYSFLLCSCTPKAIWKEFSSKMKEFASKRNVCFQTTVGLTHKSKYFYQCCLLFKFLFIIIWPISWSESIYQNIWNYCSVCFVKSGGWAITLIYCVLRNSYNRRENELKLIKTGKMLRQLNEDADCADTEIEVPSRRKDHNSQQ